MEKDKNSIIRHFSEMKDFRMNRKRLYPLIEIITIAIVATLCGAESYEEIEDFGLEQIDASRLTITAKQPYGITL